MRLEVTGLDQLERKLRDLQRNAAAMSGSHEVPFTELFPARFVREHTDFQDIEGMVEASSVQSPEEIGGEAWNEFVRTRTRFAGWEEMKQAGGVDYARRRLGL